MHPQVTIYSKGHCPYCRRAKALLSERGVTKWTEFDLEITPEKRREMMAHAGGRHTVPQIFIDGQHIGGSDDLAALDRSGKLKKLLNAKTAA